MTWIIISVVLYLLGTVPTYASIEDEKRSIDWWAVFASTIWFITIIAVLVMGLIDYIKTVNIKKATKCLLPILFIFLVACNDGGSPAPDYVNRYDPEQAKYYDSIANSKLSTDTNIKIERAGGGETFTIKSKEQNYKDCINEWGYDTCTYFSHLTPVDNMQKCAQIVSKKKKRENAKGFLDTSRIFWKEYYATVIASPEKGRVAYLKPDSAWVILDSAEAFKMLLQMVEQQAKMYERK